MPIIYIINLIILHILQMAAGRQRKNTPPALPDDCAPPARGMRRPMPPQELRLFTAEEFPDPCNGLDRVAVGFNVLAGPPPSRDAPKPYYQISVMPGAPPRRCAHTFFASSLIALPS